MDKPVFRSEELEPIAALIMGRMFARVQWEQAYGDKISVASECDAMWYAARAIQKLSVVTRATHFSIASSNNMRRCAGVIECITGHRPLDHG